MDVTSYLLGKKKGGGTPVNLQTKSVTITQNGTSSVEPDEGYNGLTKVNLTTNVQPDLESKSVTITANGTTTVTPTSGKDGLSQVAITTNVESSELEEKNVTFIDYDGTVTNSYTKQEFLALNEMPSNPTHTGLTAQGWNWNLTDAKDYVTKYGELIIGQNYITDDGSTRVYIRLDDRLNPYCGFAIVGTATIDWGDGSTLDTVTGTSQYTMLFTQHIYASPGDYVIKISSDSPIYIYNSSDYKSCALLSKKIVYSSKERNYVYSNCIKKIELGNVLITSQYAFNECYSLKSITIPNNINIGTFQSAWFANCYSLKTLVIPSGVTTMSGSLNALYSIKYAPLPKSINTLNGYFYNNVYVDRVIIPENIATIKNVASQMKQLKKIIIPEGVENVDANCFTYNDGLQRVEFPSTLLTIGNQAFMSCYGIKILDFSKATSVPTLGNYAIPTEIEDLEIRVPSALYDDWIVANNWSSFSSKIVAV